MNAEQSRDLVKRIEVAAWPDPDLAAVVLESLKSALPGDAAPMTLEPDLIESTDAALHLVNLSVPNWSIILQGMAHEPDSRWSCTLRKGTVRDDDELIGLGKGPTPSLALLSALLTILVSRTNGYM